MRTVFLAIASAIILIATCGIVSAQTSAVNDAGMGAGADQTQPAVQARQSSQAAPKAPVLDQPIHIVPFREPGSGPLLSAAAIAGAHANYYGGPIISNVHIVQVLYGPGSYLPNVSSVAAPSMASFYTDIPQSRYFDMLNEYSTAGAATVDGLPGSNQTLGHGFFDGQFSITPATANNGAVITDQQIQAEILSQVNAGALPAPVLDAQGNVNTIYMVYFPAGKQITLDSISSCVRGGFCAYHSSTVGKFASKSLYYGVFPDTQAPSGCSLGCGLGLPFDIVTNVASHELSEAVTDANVGNANALGRPLAWLDPVNSEIGDICVGQPGTVVVNGFAYTVQQEFSNFQNTCVAEPANFTFNGPFSNVAPGTETDLLVSLQSGASIFNGTYTGTVHFTSTDAAAILPADYTFNFADAASHLFVFTLKTPGQQTITATDLQRPGVTGSTPISVVPQSASFLVVAMPQNARAGTAVTATITALDSNFSLATSYNGTVHFTSTDATAVLPADSKLTAGMGTFPVTFKTVGTQSFRAADTLAPSTLVGLFDNINVFTPSANATTVTLAASPNPSVFGQAVTYTAAVTGGASTPGGTVAFQSEGGAFPIFANLDAAGHAQSSIILPGGSHTMFAEYSGDASHQQSSSTAVFAVVNPAPTTVVVTSSQSPSPFGGSVTLTASVSSSAANAIPGFVPPPGNITFKDGATPLAVMTAPLPNGNIAFTTKFLTAGTHPITAEYSGISSFAATTSAPVSQVINPAPPANYSITSNKGSATIFAGQAATFVITTQSLNFFDGTVAFSCGNLPALTTCSFSPPIALVEPAGPTFFTTLTVKTTGPHAALRGLQKDRSVYAMLGFGSLAFCFGLLAIAAPKKNRKAFYSALLTALLVAALVNCGGGGGSAPPPPPTPTPAPATPAGTTTMTVSATGTGIDGVNPSAPTQQLNISITVQP
jgi:hypothetical protein